MVKLLEFNPEENTPGDVVKSISEDVWFSCTPDMPALRFAKRIPVFIWDELKTYKSLESTLGITPKDYTTTSYLSFTKDKFLPFFNSKKGKHDYLLPASPTWNKSLKGTLPDAQPKEIVGRLINVNLFTLRLLDLHYQNTMVHQRHKLKFVTKGFNSSPDTEVDAWVYTLPTNSFTKYFPHENEYKLLGNYEVQECDINTSYFNPGGVYTSVYSPKSV